jgi:hypothetical protein
MPREAGRLSNFQLQNLHHGLKNQISATKIKAKITIAIALITDFFILDLSRDTPLKTPNTNINKQAT